MDAVDTPVEQMEKHRLKQDKYFAKRLTQLSGKTRIQAPVTQCQRP